jgi:hypothetical protein
MARALGVAIALVLTLAPAARAYTEPSGKLVAGGEETVLRLHDLPPGYQISDDSGCGSLGPVEGDWPRRFEAHYMGWLLKYWPEGCDYEYEQIFAVPGLEPVPPLVEGGTLNNPGEDAADSGFGLYITLVNHATEGQRRTTVSIPPSGVQAALFRSENELVEGQIHQPATILFWRFGKLFSFVEAAGLDPRRNDSAALHFAEIQQERLEHPSPYTEAEKDDTEVWLDDPSLQFPIYWMGRRFDPGDGYPATELEEAFSGWVGPPGQKTALRYQDFTLGTWTRRSWKSYQPTVLGKLNLHRRCTRKTAVPLAGGGAVVYAGYASRHLRSCPKRAPDDYWAIAHLGQMVVGVNMTHCTGCLEPGYGPYNSLAGMKTILGGLQLRPEPDFSAVP